MEILIDYIILFFCSTILMLTVSYSTTAIIPICIAIILVCMSIYFDKFPIRLLLYFTFCVLSLVYPQLMFYSSLILYSFFNTPYMYVCLLYCGVFNYNYNHTDVGVFKMVILIFIIVMSYILKYRTNKYLDEREHFQKVRESLDTNYSKLNVINHELLEKQDYEITNATLNERNRIAREIHDSVGHILSSSILQIAALTSITKDETTKEYLQNINKTLTDGMNSIRSSIHNIHNESIDLNLKLKELTDGFDFCKIEYSYNIQDDFSIKAKYAIIFIIKEALTNIIKHSNATLVKISIIQNPAFYKIDIHDNGTNINATQTKKSQGMGTISIYDRISSLNGTINITKTDGYRIYITFPTDNKN